MNLLSIGSSPLFWFLVIFGASIGSFLNVVILRVPEGTFLKHARSICPACGNVIPFWLNIPIVGWFFLRGKASCCGAKLSIQYPVVEALTAVIFVIHYYFHPFLGWNLDQIMFDGHEALRFGHATIFVCLMVVCSVIDLRLMIIPDVISIPMMALTPIVVWLHPDLDMFSALLGVALGAGFLYAVAWIYWIIRKEYGLGFGDVKLLGAIGGWLGYQAVFPTLFLGSIIGSILGVVALGLAKKLSFKARVPFGPFLATGAIIHLWWGPELFVWIMQR